MGALGPGGGNQCEDTTLNQPHHNQEPADKKRVRGITVHTPGAAGRAVRHQMSGAAGRGTTISSRRTRILRLILGIAGGGIAVAITPEMTPERTQRNPELSRRIPERRQKNPEQRQSDAKAAGSQHKPQDPRPLRREDGGRLGQAAGVLKMCYRRPSFLTTRDARDARRVPSYQVSQSPDRPTTDDTAAPRLLPLAPWALPGPSRFLVSVSPLPPAPPKMLWPPSRREIKHTPPGGSFVSA